ncbi:MAG: pullulanase [Mycobacterium sp.]
MDYCFGTGDGTASMWTGPPDLDADGDGTLDAVGLDFDGDGLRDDALADLDHDGTADHALLDVDDDGTHDSWFTDDGSGTWSVPVDRVTRSGSADGGQLRWFGLDGTEYTGGPLIDFDGDGEVEDRIFDTDADGLADRVIAGDGRTGFVDTDGDGHWDIKLVDADGDGAADDASHL